MIESNTNWQINYVLRTSSKTTVRKLVQMVWTQHLVYFVFSKFLHEVQVLCGILQAFATLMMKIVLDNAFGCANLPNINLDQEKETSPVHVRRDLFVRKRAIYICEHQGRAKSCVRWPMWTPPWYMWLGVRMNLSQVSLKKEVYMHWKHIGTFSWTKLKTCTDFDFKLIIHCTMRLCKCTSGRSLWKPYTRTKVWLVLFKQDI